jgi:hypothetical protein
VDYRWTDLVQCIPAGSNTWVEEISGHPVNILNPLYCNMTTGISATMWTANTEVPVHEGYISFDCIMSLPPRTLKIYSKSIGFKNTAGKRLAILEENDRYIAATSQVYIQSIC